MSEYCARLVFVIDDVLLDKLISYANHHWKTCCCLPWQLFTRLLRWWGRLRSSPPQPFIFHGLTGSKVDSFEWLILDFLYPSTPLPFLLSLFLFLSHFFPIPPFRVWSPDMEKLLRVWMKRRRPSIYTAVLSSPLPPHASSTPSHLFLFSVSLFQFVVFVFWERKSYWEYG